LVRKGNFHIPEALPFSESGAQYISTFSVFSNVWGFLFSRWQSGEK